MKATVYHQNGSRRVIAKAVLNSAVEALQAARVNAASGSSGSLKAIIGAQLRSRGWSGSVVLGAGSQINITALRDRCGLCLQTGNMARMYADLLKLQALFANGRVTAGILILPEATCAKQIGSNIANVERLQRELDIFGRVITLPLAVIGFQNTELGSYS